MRNKITSLSLAVLMSFAMVVPVWAASPQPADQQASLYKRLGGYDALAAVTDDFLGRMATDPQLAKFFKGHNTENLKVDPAAHCGLSVRGHGRPLRLYGPRYENWRIPGSASAKTIGRRASRI